MGRALLAALPARHLRAHARHPHLLLLPRREHPLALQQGQEEAGHQAHREDRQTKQSQSRQNADKQTRLQRRRRILCDGQKAIAQNVQVANHAAEVSGVYGVVVHHHAHQLRDDDQLGAHQRQQVPQLRPAHHDGHPGERVLLACAGKVQEETSADRLLYCRWNFLRVPAFLAERYISIIIISHNHISSLSLNFFARYISSNETKKTNPPR